MSLCQTTVYVHYHAQILVYGILLYMYTTVYMY